MEKRDNLHLSLRELDGYNKAFNVVVCEREAGKSTELERKLYSAYKEGYTSLVFRRNIVDITEEYIDSIERVVHKFDDPDLMFKWNKGSLKDGVISIKDNEGKVIFIVIALSVKVSKIKSLVLPNIKYMFFDEFICNPKFDEKYLKGEADKFKEAYNTFYRESKIMIKCYFFGNPYSMWNPYFVWWGVDVAKLKRGEIYTIKNVAIWCYEISPELREYILKRNPLYEFDDAYTRYAFFGQAINDEHIRLSGMPDNYTLKFLFRTESKYIGVYQNRYLDTFSDMYYCKFEDNIGRNRDVYCYDFGELIDRCALISFEERDKFSRFKKAMQKNLVLFEEIAVYYLIIEIYKFI